jgi:hypothetical protein
MESPGSLRSAGRTDYHVAGFFIIETAIKKPPAIVNPVLENSGNSAEATLFRPSPTAPDILAVIASLCPRIFTRRGFSQTSSSVEESRHSTCRKALPSQALKSR